LRAGDAAVSVALGALVLPRVRQAGGVMLAYPTPPANASALGREAYTLGLSPLRVGLTEGDRRLLGKGVKRGELHYGRGLYGWWRWEPVMRTSD